MSKWSTLQDVDLKLLRVFATVVESGGFTAAQYSLNISKSTLSEYIKDLEVRLGVTLCQRGPKGFVLFDEGKEVYQAAREMFGAIESFQNAITDINTGETGNLTIAIQDGVVGNPASAIHVAMNRFATRYPNVRLVVEIMLGFQVLGRVADGLASVGIAMPSQSHSALTFDPLFVEQAALYCGPAHPLFELAGKGTALKEEDLWRYRYANRGHLEASVPSIANFDKTTAKGDVGWGGEAHLALILSGRDIGYLSLDLAAPFVGRGALRQLNVEGSDRSSWIAAVSTPRVDKFAMTRAFIGELKKAHQQPA